MCEVAERFPASAAQSALVVGDGTGPCGADQLGAKFLPHPGARGGGDIRDSDAATLAAATADLPRASSSLGEATVVDALVPLASRSGTAARWTITSGGQANNVKVGDPMRAGRR